MSGSSVESDKALGVGLAASAVAVIGAIVMYGGPTQLSKAGGFALAVLAGLAGVMAFQILE
ncbi:MAG: hypothetical protein A07HR60_00787 [uncultured archaeon A07HR60]|jgi:hypothetical protein|nr:MAG: hypothetical protein A07HR60_00787 [uncultured archaeon A07HR60]